MPIVTRIVPCLWFDDQAEEAASFYTSIFSNSKIGTIARYGEAGHEIHGRPAGSVLTVAFELDGQPFTALNGGPVFRFNEAISFQVMCDTQEDVDYYWENFRGRRRKGAAVWLAQGPVRCFLAGRARDRHTARQRPRLGKIPARDAGPSANEKAGHCRAEAGVRRLTSPATLK